MKKLLAALFLISSVSVYASNECQTFLNSHPVVIFSDFTLAGQDYRYTVTHAKVATNCEIDIEFNIATIKSDSAISIKIQQYENGTYNVLSEKKFDKFMVNLNTYTAYYPVLSDSVPFLVTARKTKENRLMTTYMLGNEKVTVESDYLR